jgi:hypothetical protein
LLLNSAASFSAFSHPRIEGGAEQGLLQPFIR